MRVGERKVPIRLSARSVGALAGRPVGDGPQPPEAVAYRGKPREVAGENVAYGYRPAGRRGVKCRRGGMKRDAVLMRYAGLNERTRDSLMRKLNG